MRRFEFVEGGSAKFWEISRDETEVTVRWGRVGTNGQTKVKTFDDQQSAATHESKLIGEKTKKGYVESAASSPAAPVAGVAAGQPAEAGVAADADPAGDVAEDAEVVVTGVTARVKDAGEQGAARDEDTFVFPAAWYRHRYARQGSVGPVRFVVDPNARRTVDEEMARDPRRVGIALRAPSTDPAVGLEAFAWQEGKPEATPRGAAAVAVATAIGNWRTRDKLVAFADVWIAEHGLRFAAQAAADMMSMIAADDDPVASSNDHTYGVRHLLPGQVRQSFYSDVSHSVLLRVRGALAAASAAEYADVVAALAPYRDAHVYARTATSVLVPTEREWVEQDVDSAVADRDVYRASLLTTAAFTREQLDALAPETAGWLICTSLAMLSTIVEGVGPGAVSALFHWFGEANDAEAQRRLLSVIAVLPGDEAIGGLIERVDQKYVAPVLLEAAGRYPARAMRLLAEAATKRTVADLLRAHVLAHPELVEPVVAQLDAEAAKRVETIVGDASSLTVAPLASVPPVLVDPPWQHRVKAAKPVVIAGLQCTDAASVEWAEGEQEAWAGAHFYRYSYRDADESWEQRLQRVLNHRQGSWLEAPTFFLEAPEELARPVLAHWEPRETWHAAEWMKAVVARFGLDALPLALAVSRRSPAEGAASLAPYASPDVAVLMAEWFARLKSVRATTLAWLLRHPVSAARGLVPVALSKAGVPRRQAENALLILHTNGFSEQVRAAAAGYGPEVAAAIETLLATDPLSVLPARMPVIPGWATPGLLPPVKVSDGVLPAEATGNLITMLAISRLDDPYAGLNVVKAACNPASLAEFGWGLFQRWQMAGAPSKENWTLEVLGLIGDDETVRRLSPLVLAWPGEGGHAKAVAGLNVLAAIGTDVALMHLHGVAQRAKFKGLKAAAKQKMDEVAAGLGLSAEQLADRLVPDLGLDTDGSMRLDYGPRQFTVGFDEQLRPYVADSAGKRLKALPKPGARDDDELATAAYKTFSGLKKDVRTIAADQIRRLERAMVTGRRWTGAEFRRLFVEHPLLWHIVRRLVWGLYDESGKLVGGVRVAEDRSFSTVEDDETTIADDAIVGVAHPLHLAESLPDWVEIFADYEILQPFPQLSRPTFALTVEEAAQDRLIRFEGVTVPTGRVIGLERRGWRREEPQDAGIQGSIELVVDDNRELVIDLDPGIAVGAMDIFPEQKLDRIYLWNGVGSRWGNRSEGSLALGELDAVTVSEIIRDLTEITA
ncbi:WGR and DUF4132 domain-containing protein [Actinoplanes sp. TFC3]|uniref:WGR and DUF4132 domain-containing protein n=1 Tax=Actinoplanes sp. TFC3 TaxID=1710355 RepID=UPI00082BEAE4|nr:WGR and DUF4132 domain-containing protein [Actinoplanes sp. TFC3]